MRSAYLQFDSLNLEVRAVFFDMSQDDFLEGCVQPEDLPNHDLRAGIDLIEPCVEACKFDSFWECDLEVSDSSTCSTTCLLPTACGQIACMRRFHVFPLVVLIWTCMRL